MKLPVFSSFIFELVTKAWPPPSWTHYLEQGFAKHPPPNTPLEHPLGRSKDPPCFKKDPPCFKKDPLDIKKDPPNENKDPSPQGQAPTKERKDVPSRRAKPSNCKGALIAISP